MKMHMLTRTIFGIAAAGTMAAGVAVGGEHDRRIIHHGAVIEQNPCCPPVVVPAPTMVVPQQQGTPAPLTPSVTTPSAPTTPTPPTPSMDAPPVAANLDLGGGLALGESMVALANISTYGDQFSRGAARANSAVRILQPGALNGRTGRVLIENLRYNQAAGQYENTDPTTLARTFVPVTVSIDQIGSAPGFTTNGQIEQSGPPPQGGRQSVPLNPNGVAQARGLVGVAGPLAAAVIESAVNPDAQLVLFQLGDPISGFVEPQADGFNSLDYSAPLFSVVSAPLAIHVPSPSDGGVAGRVKIADDASPLPRDRLIFNYDHFANVAISNDGVPVNRYVFGFEKTFLDGRASFEVRAPIADTLSSTSIIGTEETGAELGNVLTTFKFMFLSDEAVAASVGLGVSLPTADGIHVRNIDGSSLLAIPNRSIGLTPFLGILVTPSDRLFVQAFAAVSFDANGTAAYVNPNFTGLTDARIGGLTDGDLLQVDLQVGWWILREESGWLQGLAPFVELHSNTELNDGDIAANGNFAIGNLAGRLDELNLSAGFLSKFGDNLLVTSGVVVPLRNGDDRIFDYQIGVRASWLFGASARSRSMPMSISTF
jgi:hypothetical protein